MGAETTSRRANNVLLVRYEILQTILLFVFLVARNERATAVKSGNALSLTLPAQRCSGRRNIALVVGREQFIQSRDILLVPDDFDIMTHESLVFFW